MLKGKFILPFACDRPLQDSCVVLREPCSCMSLCRHGVQEGSRRTQPCSQPRGISELRSFHCFLPDPARIVPWPPHGPLDMKLLGEGAELARRLSGGGVGVLGQMQLSASEGCCMVT